MDTNTLTGIIVVVLALIVVAGFLRYKQNAKVKVKVPGASVELDGSNETPATPPERSRIKTGSILAEKGDAEIVSQRGDRDIETGEVIAGKNVRVRDEVPSSGTDPNPKPPA